MAVRLQQAPWVALVGVDLMLRARRRRGWVPTALAFAGGALLAFAPQLMVWRWQFGSIHDPQPPGHMRWADPALVETLFSTRGRRRSPSASRARPLPRSTSR